MSEPGSSGQQPADDDASHASVGGDPSRAGGGRTEGEATVDEDMGSGDPSDG